MRYLVLLLICIAHELDISAEKTVVSEAMLNRVEMLLMKKEIKEAEKLLNQEIMNLKDSIYTSSYRYNFVVGLLYYNKESYEASISAMETAITEMDSLLLWDCENYLKTAYYIADSYIHINKMKESEMVINHALIKCVNSYSNCIYAKKIYQLLLVIYNEMGCSEAVMEQIHNEIQKIAINIYSSNKSNKDGEQVRDHFMFFYNYINSPALTSKDSIYMNEGRAAYLNIIGEDEESIRLYEKVKVKLPKYDQQLRTIYESLQKLYSKTGRTNSIDKLLSEMYEYSSKMNLDYNEYTENIVVGYYLNQSGYYHLAQIYYERCDSFLNANRELQDWINKKTNILSKMVFNCRSSGSYDKVIYYCKEYEELVKAPNYDDVFFIHYNQGLALRAVENYREALKEYEYLKSYVQDKKNTNHIDYVMINCLLGVCYANINKNDESIGCTNIAIDLYQSLNMDDISLLGSLYNNLGKAYLQKKDYNKAMQFLKISAEIQIEENGMVSENTQRYINECNRQEK